MPVEERLTDRRRVLATLADAGCTMPHVPDGGPVASIRWLRRNVARFADGGAHERRRHQVADLLGEVEPALLRERAAELTRTVLRAADGHPVDVMARVARIVPLQVLTAALRMPPLPPDAVALVAQAYQPNAGEEEAADGAVARLVEALGGVADEITAARIGLLVQAYDATAGLVGNAVLMMLRQLPDAAAGTVVAETLLQDPPVRATRRLATETGAILTLDLAASGLPFGAGPHRCPGRDHAVAMAEGIVESFRGSRLGGPDVDYHASALLRVPITLVVIR